MGHVKRLELQAILIVLLCLGDVSSAHVMRRIREAKPFVEQQNSRFKIQDRGRYKRSGETDPRVKQALFQTPQDVYIERYQTYCIPCPQQQEGEDVILAYWYKGTQRISQFSVPAYGENYTLNNHYRMSDSLGLIIDNVNKNDSGEYECIVVPRNLKQRTSLFNVTASVFAGQELPAISNCSFNEECSIEVDEKDTETLVNCSVSSIYPEAKLLWSLSGCEEPKQSAIFSTKSYLVFNSAADTYDQYEELHLQTNSSINCTYRCNASGLVIANSPITRTLFVKGKYFNLNTYPGEPLEADNTVMVIVVLVSVMSSICIILISCVVWRRRHMACTCNQKDPEGNPASTEEDSTHNPQDGDRPPEQMPRKSNLGINEEDNPGSSSLSNQGAKSSVAITTDTPKYRIVYNFILNVPKSPFKKTSNVPPRQTSSRPSRRKFKRISTPNKQDVCTTANYPPSSTDDVTTDPTMKSLHRDSKVVPSHVEDASGNASHSADPTSNHPETLSVPQTSISTPSGQPDTPPSPQISNTTPSSHNPPTPPSPHTPTIPLSNHNPNNQSPPRDSNASPSSQNVAPTSPHQSQIESSSPNTNLPLHSHQNIEANSSTLPSHDIDNSRTPPKKSNSPPLPQNSDTKPSPMVSTSPSPGSLVTTPSEIPDALPSSSASCRSPDATSSPTAKISPSRPNLSSPASESPSNNTPTIPPSDPSSPGTKHSNGQSCQNIGKVQSTKSNTRIPTSNTRSEKCSKNSGTQTAHPHSSTPSSDPHPTTPSTHSDPTPSATHPNPSTSPAHPHSSTPPSQPQPNTPPSHPHLNAPPGHPHPNTPPSHPHSNTKPAHTHPNQPSHPHPDVQPCETHPSASPNHSLPSSQPSVQLPPTDSHMSAHAINRISADTSRQLSNSQQSQRDPSFDQESTPLNTQRPNNESAGPTKRKELKKKKEKVGPYSRPPKSKPRDTAPPTTHSALDTQEPEHPDQGMKAEEGIPAEVQPMDVTHNSHLPQSLPEVQDTEPTDNQSPPDETQHIQPSGQRELGYTSSHDQGTLAQLAMKVVEGPEPMEDQSTSDDSHQRKSSGQEELDNPSHNQGLSFDSSAPMEEQSLTDETHHLQSNEQKELGYPSSDDQDDETETEEDRLLSAMDTGEESDDQRPSFHKQPESRQSERQKKLASLNPHKQENIRKMRYLNAPSPRC